MSVANPDPGDDINTSGGAYVGGNVQPGGAFIGRDQNIYMAPAPTAQPYLWVNVPPRPTQPLVGRDGILDDLVARLLSGHSPALSTDGLPGAGKTALAVALAHDARVQAHFTGGVLWGGLGTSPDPGTIVNQWAAAAGVDLSDLPDLPGRVQRLSAVLASRTLLVILDDAWDPDTPKRLRLGCPHAVHLLTTRSREIARAFAGAGQQVHVPELAPDPALQLLWQLAPEACIADPPAAAHLAEAVGGLPLALELLGGYLAVPERSLFPDLSAQAFAELADPQRRLALAQQRLGDATGRAQTLQEVIQLSLDHLGRSSLAALAVFYALGAFAPKPAHFDRDAAASVTGTDSATLALLVKFNLVEMDNEGRLALHQVIADAACTHMPQDAADRHDAWYRRIVDEDRYNWQQIQSIYDQVRWVLERTTVSNERILLWFRALHNYWSNQGLRSEDEYWTRQALTFADKHNDIAATAELLDNLGLIYSALGDNQQGLAYYEQALPLRRQVGDKGGEAATLTNLGAVYSALGDKQQALAYYEQALPLRRQVGDKGGEATTLTNIGTVYSDLGDKQQALTYFEQALPLQRQVGDKGGEAATLANIGIVYSDLGDKQQALVYFEQALVLRRQVGDKVGEAATLTNIGGAYSGLGDKQQALAYYEQALPLQRQVGDKGGEATTLNNIGTVYSDLGDTQQALAYYEQALTLIRQVGSKGGVAATLNNIGMVYSALGDNQQALAHFEQALPLQRQVGDKRGEAATLNNTGLIYSALGDNQQGLAYYEQALPLRRQVGDKGGEAVTFNNIGAVYSALGDKQQALAYYEQALALQRQVGDKGGEAASINNIGAVYSDLGDKQQALTYFEQALALQRQVGDKGGEAATLANIGTVYSDLGDKQQALVYFEQALVLRRQVGDKSGECVTRVTIAIVAMALGRLDRAVVEMEIVVHLDKTMHHPNLASHRRMLEDLRRRRKGRR